MKTILYRAADEPNPEIWGRYLEAATFDDADAAAALLSGWATHPQDIPEDARATAAKPKKATAE